MYPAFHAGSCPRFLGCGPLLRPACHRKEDSKCLEHTLKCHTHTTHVKRASLNKADAKCLVDVLRMLWLHGLAFECADWEFDQDVDSGSKLPKLRQVCMRELCIECLMSCW